VYLATNGDWDLTVADVAGAIAVATCDRGAWIIKLVVA
jgi:hypothetical protein